MVVLMADNIQQYVQTCACGRDKASHFEGKHACLCRGCDDCKKYETPEQKKVRLTLPECKGYWIKIDGIPILVYW